MNTKNRPIIAFLTAASVAALCACSSPPKDNPRYRPAETVLEVVAVLSRHVSDDTYRFEPARDYTGRNVYRASLLRLENVELAYENELRAGHMSDVITFAKGRALERLRAYDLAAQNYRQAAHYEGPLRTKALTSASLCDALAEAASFEVKGTKGVREDFLADLERRRTLLEVVAGDVEETHYASIVLEELEHTDLVRTRFIENTRRLSKDGDLQAVASRQFLLMQHRESKYRNRHILSLADLYANLAEEYVEDNPPESLRFDPPTFEELVTAAARLYEAVANQDGATERLEASQRLEGFLAFTLRVDRDRFSR